MQGKASIHDTTPDLITHYSPFPHSPFPQPPPPPPPFPPRSWRKLEGADPETFEHIQHIQVLQRRLISKTEEVLEKDLMIQEKEKLYLELKNILARQPGPEVRGEGGWRCGSCSWSL